MPYIKNHGFSLIELIVTVSMMSVLVCVITPSFIPYIEKSRESTDLANVRNAYSEVQAAMITEDKTAVYGRDGHTIYQDDGTYSVQVDLKQTSDGWSSSTGHLAIGSVQYQDAAWINEPKKNGTCTVYSRDGEMYIDWGGNAVVLNNTNSIAKHVLKVVQNDLASYQGTLTATAYSSAYSKANSTVKTDLKISADKTVSVVVYNRDYDNYEDLKTRLTTADTASLIYNRTTGKISTIVYYDGKDYTSWSLTDDQWQDNNYINKK